VGVQKRHAVRQAVIIIHLCNRHGQSPVDRCWYVLLKAQGPPRALCASQRRHTYQELQVCAGLAADARLHSQWRALVLVLCEASKVHDGGRMPNTSCFCCQSVASEADQKRASSWMRCLQHLHGLQSCEVVCTFADKRPRIPE
jgi:hypothetical protein